MKYFENVLTYITNQINVALKFLCFGLEDLSNDRSGVLKLLAITFDSFLRDICFYVIGDPMFY